MDSFEPRFCWIFLSFTVGLIMFALFMTQLTNYETPISHTTEGDIFIDDFNFGRFMDDEELVKNLEQTMLNHSSDLVERFSNKYKRNQIDVFLWKITGEKLNGVFIDFGAGDGISHSRTLWLEINKNWNGILIEADPSMKERLANSGRKAQIFSSCLGLQKFPYLGALGVKPNYGSRLLSDEWIIYEKIVDVYCYPIYTYFLAARTNTVDLLILDINGREINALKSTPWKKVDVKALLIRYVTQAEMKEIVNYLTKESPTVYELVYYVDSFSTYMYFVQPSILRKYKQQNKGEDKDKRTSRHPK